MLKVYEIDLNLILWVIAFNLFILISIFFLLIFSLLFITISCKFKIMSANKTQLEVLRKIITNECKVLSRSKRNFNLLFYKHLIYFNLLACHTRLHLWSNALDTNDFILVAPTTSSFSWFFTYFLMCIVVFLLFKMLQNWILIFFNYFGQKSHHVLSTSRHKMILYF